MHTLRLPQQPFVPAGFPRPFLSARETMSDPNALPRVAPGLAVPAPKAVPQFHCGVLVPQSYYRCSLSAWSTILVLRLESFLG